VAAFVPSARMNPPFVIVVSTWLTRTETLRLTRLG
jgi:hypothetical protein